MFRQPLKPVFCHHCGKRLISRCPPGDTRERCVCEACGTVSYHNPTILVSSIVIVGQTLLMCRRAKEPAAGDWEVPTGYLEYGETLQEGAARETLEETGVIIEPDALELASVINLTEMGQVLITFRVALTEEPGVKPGVEVLEAQFLSEHEISQRRFAWRSLLGNGPDKFFHQLRAGQFSLKLITPAASDGSSPYRAREYQLKAH